MPKQAKTKTASLAFSLVEVMVASAILLASVATAVTLFNLTNTAARLGEEKQDAQSAISDDLSSIYKINEGFRCATPDACASENFYPNENQYIPERKGDLDSICKADGTGSGFAPLLAREINELPLSPRLISLKITRNASISENPGTSNPKNDPPHRYSVEWKNGETTLRQVTLTPTIAAWCP